MPGSNSTIGCMWFQGTLWKLPFGRHNGLYYWTEQMAGRAAFAIHREFVTNVILPNFVLVNALVYLAELGFATALILGLFVRLAGVAAVSAVRKAHRSETGFDTCSPHASRPLRRCLRLVRATRRRSDGPHDLCLLCSADCSSCVRPAAPRIRYSHVLTASVQPKRP